MDVVLPIFMKTCASRSLGGVIDTLLLKTMLKRWSCDLMSGECHGLPEVKRNYLAILVHHVLLKVCALVCCKT